jgi:uncharacterized protein (TIGR03066 family)
MNALRMLVAGVMVCLLVVGARAEKKDNAKQLVGTWEVAKSYDMGPPVGAAVSFTADGKIKWTFKVEDKESTLEGTYKFEGEKLNIMMKRGDMEVKLTRTIKKISDKELVTETEDGKVLELKRKK